jgi:hypothetical protein
MVRPLIVGCVVGLVGAAALTFSHGFRCRCPRVRNTQMIMHNVEEATVHYRFDHSDECPPSIEALVDGHYLVRSPRDTWGQTLAYRCAASDGPEITSAGPDRRFGTADDLTSSRQ